jgi:hypothetical protein
MALERLADLLGRSSQVPTDIRGLWPSGGTIPRSMGAIIGCT